MFGWQNMFARLDKAGKEIRALGKSTLDTIGSHGNFLIGSLCQAQ